jgi:hypothetical protein
VTGRSDRWIRWMTTGCVALLRRLPRSCPGSSSSRRPSGPARPGSVLTEMPVGAVVRRPGGRRSRCAAAAAACPGPGRCRCWPGGLVDLRQPGVRDSLAGRWQAARFGHLAGGTPASVISPSSWACRYRQRSVVMRCSVALRPPRALRGPPRGPSRRSSAGGPPMADGSSRWWEIPRYECTRGNRPRTPHIAL